MYWSVWEGARIARIELCALRVLYAPRVEIFFCVLRKVASLLPLFFNPPNFFHSLPQTRLKSLIGRLVIGVSCQRFRQAHHISHFIFGIVRVLVSFSIANVFHQPCRRVAKMQWNGLGARILEVLDHS